MKNEKSLKPCRVAIVDDHTFMCDGLKLLISTMSDFSFARSAGTASEATRLVSADCPDLLVVDISLPDRNGLELIKDVRAIHTILPILVVSMHAEKLYAQRALKAGARGYLIKNASHYEFQAAFRKVAAGGICVSPSLSEEILLAYASGGAKASSGGGLESLTDRELEVYQLIGEGRSTHQVAEALRVSPKTVDVHKVNIRTKLKLEDGSAVVRHAIRWHESRRLGGAD